MSEELEQLSTERPQIKPVSKFLLYSYIGFIIFTMVLNLLPKTPTVKSVVESGGLMRIMSVVLKFVLLYKIWTIIQIGRVRTTPGKAVGYLFIPIYGLYWFFQAFWGWTKDYNRVLSQYRLKGPRMSNMLGLAASTAFFILTVVFIFVFIQQAKQPQTFALVDDKFVPVQYDSFSVPVYMVAICYELVFIWFFFMACTRANYLVDNFRSGELRHPE